MRLTFHTLDVFTDRRFAGNPLAVVLDAGGLPPATMQAIAREFNLSETVFVLPAERPAHSARIRIFTPTRELPFAGHPTIGTAVLLAEIGAAGGNGERDALVMLEEPIGSVRVGVRLRPGATAYAEFDAPKLPQEAGGMATTERLTAALGLLPSEIGFENHKPTCIAAGQTYAFVPVGSLEAIAQARVNSLHWDAAFAGRDLTGAYLYTRQCLHTTSAFHARMFAPEAGVPEDPATGSAAVGLAGVVHRFDQPHDGTHRRLVEQGFEMGRPSFVAVTLVIGGGRLETVRIGGHAVRASEGTLTVD